MTVAQSPRNSGGEAAAAAARRYCSQARFTGLPAAAPPAAYDGVSVVFFKLAHYLTPGQPEAHSVRAPSKRERPPQSAMRIGRICLRRGRFIPPLSRYRHRHVLYFSPRPDGYKSEQEPPRCFHQNDKHILRNEQQQFFARL